MTKQSQIRISPLIFSLNNNKKKLEQDSMSLCKFQTQKDFYLRKCVRELE
jgi:hypothetical protein